MDPHRELKSQLTRKDFIRAGSLATFGLVLSGCGSSSSGGSATSGSPAASAKAGGGGTLLFATLGDSATQVLDPHQTYHSTGMLLYDRLTSLQPDLKTVEPGLAESWKSNKDLSVWTFRLRSGVYWHDGKPFTAADVVYSFKRMMDPKVASPHAAVMSAINPAKIKAVDDHTVVFRLDEPMWDFPVQAGSNFASVVPAHVSAAELKHGAVGTGPFTLTKFTPGQELQVKRNTKYWDPAAPGLDAVRQFFVEEPSARVDGLRTGQFNLISQLAPLDTVSLTGAPDVTVHRIDSGRLVTFNMRVDSAPFDDVRVRRALALAIDRDAMNKQVLRDGAKLGNDQPISTISPLWGDLPIPARDVAKAKQLLAEAGHPDGIDVTCYTSTILAGMVEMAVLLKEQAADAGIRIKVQQVPAGTYLDQVFGHKQFYAMGYEMRAGDPLLVMPFLTKGAWNVDGYSNPKYDAALQKARTETDEAARATYYKQAQQVLTEDVPMAIPLYHPVIEATSAAVQGYVPTPITLQRDFRSIRIAS